MALAVLALALLWGNGVRRKLPSASWRALLEGSFLAEVPYPVPPRLIHLGWWVALFGTAAGWWAYGADWWLRPRLCGATLLVEAAATASAAGLYFLTTILVDLIRSVPASVVPACPVRRVERAWEAPAQGKEIRDRPAECPGCGQQTDRAVCSGCGAAREIGQYRVVEILAARAHGRTYLGLTPDDRPVVIKEVTFARAPDVAAISAIEREAQLLGQLNHPRIPHLIESFSIDVSGLRLYLVEQYLAGTTLEAELATRRHTVSDVVRIVADVLETLAYLHRQSPRIIHRDVKPANLIRQRDGTVALVDFGAARDLHPDRLDGTLVGTVGYMPPEQLAGQVDVTSDLYALGVTALHLLSRHPPIEWLQPDGTLRLPALPQVQPRLGRVLRRLAAPRRSDRFPSAEAAVAALRRAEQPERGWAKLAVVAAGLAAAGWAALHRAPRLSPRSSLAPAVALVPAPTRDGAPAPVVTADDGAIAASEGGLALTLGEWRRGADALPPYLRLNTAGWKTGLARSLLDQKALRREAERRGLGADPTLTPIRALLAQEGISPPAHDSVEGINGRPARFARLVAGLIGKETFVARPGVLQLEQVDTVGGGSSTPRSASCSDEMAARDWSLRYQLDCRGGWYDFSPRPSDPQYFVAIPPPAIFYLEDLYGPSDLPFLHHFALRNADRLTYLITANTPGLGLMNPGPPDYSAAFDGRYHLDLKGVQVTGDISKSDAQRAYAGVAETFRSCMSLYHWSLQIQERTGTLTASLSLNRGELKDTRLVTEGLTPTLRHTAAMLYKPDSCVYALTEFGLPGSGTVIYTLGVRVE